jgi:hypothetical protein
MPSSPIDYALLLLDVSIKACLLAAAGAMGLAAFRVRNGDARHRVWTTVLLGMLLMPSSRARCRVFDSAGLDVAARHCRARGGPHGI